MQLNPSDVYMLVFECVTSSQQNSTFTARLRHALYFSMNTCRGHPLPIQSSKSFQFEGFDQLQIADHVPSRQFEYRAESKPLYFSTVYPLYLHFFFFYAGYSMHI